MVSSVKASFIILFTLLPSKRLKAVKASYKACVSNKLSRLCSLGLFLRSRSACSLASIGVNAITGTCTYISQGLIDIPAALTITATSMIMSKYGSKWSHNFDSKKLKKYYGWLCLLVAPLIPMKNYIMQKRKEEESQKQA